ncbi:MAG: HNH endonuclease [Acidobacteria bacterium]|nr:HNH endonuclease [Acidobacteriota bacterium]
MRQGEVISYIDMCRAEGVSLQRGMNFRLKTDASVILMSLRRGAPYADRIEEDGRVLIYEGHDVPRTSRVPDPKRVDQPPYNFGGGLTQNGLFYEAAQQQRSGHSGPELVRVYEKIRPGIWVFNGVFRLVDAWQESSGGRKVFKFRLELLEEATGPGAGGFQDLEHNRLIPTAVKLEVWKRDKGKCVMCGSEENLHFDHVIPYSKGGSSITPGNIQILCAKHNLSKRDRIE